MTGYLRAHFSIGYWRYGFSPVKAIGSLLSAFGVFWLLVEIFTFFGSTEITNVLKEKWFAFLVIGMGAALWNNRPQHRITCRLVGRDVKIEIKVGDMFSLPGAFVIGSNTSFDTDIASGLISNLSVQGQFTNRFYDSVNHLDSDITSQLSNFTPECTIEKQGKSVVYPIGTTFRLSARGRTAYFLAIATINEHGVSQGSFGDIKRCLPVLWEFIATHGDSQPIVMPVLGTKFCRIPQTREEIIQEIVKSFEVACSSQLPCQSLTIVVPYKDFYDNEVNLPRLKRYIQHVCEYNDYRPNAPGRGQAVE